MAASEAAAGAVGGISGVGHELLRLGEMDASKPDRSRLEPAIAVPLCGDALDAKRAGAPDERGPAACAGEENGSAVGRRS